MSLPTQTCALCGRVVTVVWDGRGFPPDISKRKLIKACRAEGCPCDPQYLAGFLGAAVAENHGGTP